jgi:hypothetical protein
MSDDDGEASFFRLEGHDSVEDPGGGAPVVSREAFLLHSYGVLNSIKLGSPGFVPDEYLESIAAETTTTAAELCTVGLWERADGGYLVLDREMLMMALDADDHFASLAAECEAAGSHVPVERPDGRISCERCLMPVDD